MAAAHARTRRTADAVRNRRAGRPVHGSRRRPGARGRDRLLHDPGRRPGRAAQRRSPARRRHADLRSRVRVFAVGAPGARRAGLLATAAVHEVQRPGVANHPAQSAGDLLRRLRVARLHPWRRVPGIRRAGSAAGDRVLHARSARGREAGDRAPQFLPVVPQQPRDARSARAAGAQHRDDGDRRAGAEVRQLHARSSDAVRRPLVRLLRDRPSRLAGPPRQRDAGRSHQRGTGHHRHPQPRLGHGSRRRRTLSLAAQRPRRAAGVRAPDAHGQPADAHRLGRARPRDVSTYRKNRGERKDRSELVLRDLRALRGFF